MFVDEAKPDDKLEVRVNVSLIRLSCDCALIILFICVYKFSSCSLGSRYSG